MRQAKVCATFGTHYSANDSVEICKICQDDRQYIPDGGQAWTTHDQLLKNNSVRILKLHDKIYESGQSAKRSSSVTFLSWSRSALTISRNFSML
ncbi:MAG TPA: hypothetical protein VIT44_03670 [Cyclobacteriaceae bacterium]